jgi:hypothetical protein
MRVLSLGTPARAAQTHAHLQSALVKCTRPRDVCPSLQTMRRLDAAERHTWDPLEEEDGAREDPEEGGLTPCEAPDDEDLVPVPPDNPENPWSAAYWHDPMAWGCWAIVDGAQTIIPDYDFSNERWKRRVATDVGWETFWTCAPASSCSLCCCCCCGDVRRTNAR